MSVLTGGMWGMLAMLAGLETVNICEGGTNVTDTAGGNSFDHRSGSALPSRGYGDGMVTIPGIVQATASVLFHIPPCWETFLSF